MAGLLQKERIDGNYHKAVLEDPGEVERRRGEGWGGGDRHI